jgi:hypothetical protein
MKEKWERVNMPGKGKIKCHCEKENRVRRAEKY